MATKKKDKKKAPRKQRKTRAKAGKKHLELVKAPESEESKARESYKAEGPTAQTTAFLQMLAYGKLALQVEDTKGNITNEMTLVEFIHQLGGNIEEQGRGAAISKRIQKELKTIQKIHADAIKSLLPRYRTELVKD